MVVVQGKVAGWAFMVYLFLTLYFLRDFDMQMSSLILYKSLGLLCIFLLSSCLPHSEVIKRSAFLGFVFGSGLFLSFDSYYLKWKCLGWYLAALSFFHFSEYIMTALYNADKLSVDSFLLNHSLEYKVAAVVSWVEFLLELYFLPVLKAQLVVSILGLLMVIFGESLRKLAMITAKSNFTHVVQFEKRDNHVLVTTGIYSWCRHPAYVGWFYWSIGTQLVLCNPICFTGYAVASWKFFKERIWDEEISLITFFGQDYLNYKKKVGTGLPFIEGFRIPIDEDQ